MKRTITPQDIAQWEQYKALKKKFSQPYEVSLPLYRYGKDPEYVYKCMELGELLQSLPYWNLDDNYDVTIED